MLHFHRGERRYQNHRLLKWFVNQELNTSHLDRTDSAERHWALVNARFRLHHRTRCSCSMCCTPRRTYGNGKMSRTFQEYRFIERFNDVE